MKLILFSVLFSASTFAATPKLYCGEFHWAGKMSTDNIWIKDGKYNPSIDSETENYEKFYNELGLQTWKEGSCICVKGIVEKAPDGYETSGEKGYLFKKISGLYTCHTHVEIKTDIEALKKLGLNLGPYYKQNKELFLKWGLRSSDVLMSFYDQNLKINSSASLTAAIEKNKEAKALKFKVIRDGKVQYVDYLFTGK